jgi:hypothetical protein
VEYELGRWSDAVQKARKKAVQDLHQLERTARQDLVNGAVECHLRLSNANKKKEKYVIPAIYIYIYISNVLVSLAARGSVVAKVLCYRLEGCGFDTR